MQLAYGLLAFAIAAGAAGLELITTQYPQTLFCVRKSTCFYGYMLVYAAIAFFATLGFDNLDIQLQGMGVTESWVQAIAIGLSTKALLHIRIFNVSVGSQSFPIGTESLTMVFEPWLLRNIELDEYNLLQKFVASRAEKYNDIDHVKNKITNNIPSKIPNAEKAAFLADLEARTTVTSAMNLYLRVYGKRNFSRVFE